MNNGKYVFSQITDFLPKQVFDSIVACYHGDKRYPEKLRRIKFYDTETIRTFVFLTNNMDLEATQLALLFKKLWEIELFFKWIKQHLKIKSFWGTS